MSLPPSIPSHGGPPASYQPYPTPPGPFSRLESMPSGDHYRPREPGESQTSAQRLPSLRTLLEPELLDKPSDHSLRQVTPQHGHNASAQYRSSSPTLKRRHNFESHAHGHFERNPTALQVPYAHRPPLLHAHTEQQFTTPPTPGSAPSTGSLEYQRHGGCTQPAHDSTAGSVFRRPSIASESAGTLSSHAVCDELEDPSRPVRRRIDALSRAPIRASRCIAQREMPGEGLCYIYEDGTYCRAVIDGEPVNPSWGITKAGKPRKRLAQACLTCREKKIKCEPGYPKCHQGLNQPNQPGTRNGSTEASPPTPVAATLRNYATESMSPSVSSEKVDRIAGLRENLRTADARYSGATLQSRDYLPPPSLAGLRDASVHSHDSDWSNSVNPGEHHNSSAGLYQDHLALQWEQDPGEMDPEITLHLLDLYFLHAGRATYGMFPRKAFKSWARFGRAKSQDDRMLLYSVLAIGSLFSPNIDKRALGKRFAAVATYAAEKRFGRFTLQLCQSRLLLALYNFAQGKSQEAWDYCGAGLRAISALRLNTEEGMKELADEASELEYGFDRLTFEECCRRTFWSGFLMDRYNGFFGGTLFVVSIEDAFVRLPCVEATYENSTPCDTPLFDYQLLNRFAPKTPVLGHMAYLCLISTLWGDVLAFTGRAARRPDTGYEQHYEPFYTKTYERLEGWLAMLPTNLQYTPQNLENSIAEGNVGTFMSLHALYHATIIRLNRQIRLTAMCAEKISRNIEHAFHNASNFLSMMHSLALINRQRRNDTSEYFFSTPFPGYALMLSIDVLSSAGTFATLPNLIDTVAATMFCIDELATFWASARTQQKAVSNRLKQLTDIDVEQKQDDDYHGRFWKIGDSLDVAFGKDDAMYHASNMQLFQVVDQLTGR
ncbi:DNA binding [Ascochyta rabiei]|uniref:DNA binding n=1 Tax=Didymella rabiei TaxID=5454 RepID=A0A163K2Y9_DIDRA|nr:DNA binding [Ascochyta rabiei]